jgi:hypothetical protein
MRALPVWFDVCIAMTNDDGMVSEKSKSPTEKLLKYLEVIETKKWKLCANNMFSPLFAYVNVGLFIQLIFTYDTR